MSDEPVIPSEDARKLCDQVYETWVDALAEARRLQAARWVVVEDPPHLSRRPDGLVRVASVYHPLTHESPGDLLTAEVPPVPPHEPGTARLLAALLPPRPLGWVAIEATGSRPAGGPRPPHGERR